MKNIDLSPVIPNMPRKLMMQKIHQIIKTSRLPLLQKGYMSSLNHGIF